ncbi:MAG TPA: hypothetical protein VFK05_04375 [Polyangiaceae bacterium]|nr:hypothetical protein [Polyangiaceae bacterium]
MSEKEPERVNPYAAPQQDGEARPALPAFTGERDASRPEVVRYRYQPRLVPMLLVVLFFGACLLFYVWRASNNDRGLIINGLITLETEGATTFYAVLAVLSAGFVLVGVWALATRLRGPSYLVFDTDQLSVPSRFGRRPRLVPYASMREIKLLRVQGQSMLQIETEGGKVTVAAIMLASDAQLSEVGEALVRARDRARSSPKHAAQAP